MSMSFSNDDVVRTTRHVSMQCALYHDGSPMFAYLLTAIPDAFCVGFFAQLEGECALGMQCHHDRL